MNKQFVAALAAAGLVLPLAAHAAQISTQTTPAGAAAMFTAPVVETFEGFSSGTYAVLNGAGGLTITTDQPGFVDSDFAGSYNTFGTRSLHNCYCDTSFGSVTFTFSSAVNGAGFFWGAADSSWTLSAYGAGNALLGSFALPATGPSNAGDFVGFTDAGIVKLTLTGSSDDYVFIDNVTFGGRDGGQGNPVPEPATWAMMLLGFGGVGSILRASRRRLAAA